MYGGTTVGNCGRGKELKTLTPYTTPYRGREIANHT